MGADNIRYGRWHDRSVSERDILDEAASALDGRSEEQVQRAMEHVTKSKKTVLSIAHRLFTVRQCDSILVMEGGRIVQSGTFDELSRDVKGPFWDLMKTQLIHER